MRHVAWACCAISLLLAWLPVRAADDGKVWRLTGAQSLVQTDVPAWQPPAMQLAASLPGAWREVTMPDHSAVSRVDPGTMYEAKRTELRWYRLMVPRAALEQPGAALYLPRVHLRGSVAVYLDRRLVPDPSLAVGSTFFNLPLLIPLAPQASDSTSAELLLRLEVVPGTFHAIAAPWVGAYNELLNRQHLREWLQVQGPRVASTCLLILGLFALLVGLRRRGEPQHLWFFALTVFFFLRTLHYHALAEWADASRTGSWFAWMTINTLAWISAVAVRVAAAFHRQRYPRAEGALWALVVLVSLATLPWVGAQVPALALGPLVYPLHMSIALVAVGLLAHAARRSGSGHTAALAAVLAINLLLGVHDWLLRLAVISPENIYLLPYGGLAMFGVVMHAMARGYSQALVQAEQSAVVLDRRLAEREAELRDSHERLRRVERQQVLTDERQRLMREMHDGLGSTLASSLVALQRGRLPPDAVAQMLRESVDELRLTIDSLDPAGDDPLLLLANLRYRLAPRLEAAGITLDWRLHELPALPALAPAASLHLLRMLQEALANVVKHAQASRVTVSAEVSDRQLMMVVADDGVGFDPVAVRGGRGLGNLRRRAESLGARVELDSSPNGTSVRIVLPL